MEEGSNIIGVCGLFLTVINLLIGIIIAFVLKAIQRIEDRHVTSIGELHKKIEKYRDIHEDKREKDLTEMRGSLDRITRQISNIGKPI